jgi:hypothetical protein
VATNRFNGWLSTPAKMEGAERYGLLGGVLNELAVIGDLTEAGAGSDSSLNEDYSSTATFAAFKATGQTVIHRMVLSIGLGTYTGATAIDQSLWLGGAAALTNGVIWGVSTSTTGSPNLFASAAAKTIEGFSSIHGAEVRRYFYTVDATAADNFDHIIVEYEFPDMFGFPIQLRKNDLIGIYLNDNLSTSGLTFTGKVFGRLVFD